MPGKKRMISGSIGKVMNAVAKKQQERKKKKMKQIKARKK
tara:strand:- start:7 stop:126 length:120 start_codon:yes stop_codon:yes gene_type:complete